MEPIKPGMIVRHKTKDITGEVIDVEPDHLTILISEHSDPVKSDPPAQFIILSGVELTEVGIYDEQKKLNTYLSDKSPKAVYLFRHLLVELFALVGWRPGKESWEFTASPKTASHPTLRLYTERTSQMFHFWVGDCITIAINPGKKYPAEYMVSFPKKQWFHGGDAVDIEGTELNEKVILHYAEILKAIYNHHINLKNRR